MRILITKTPVSNVSIFRYVACQRGHVDVVVRLLTCAGIRINQARNDGVTPLCVACTKGKY